MDAEAELYASLRRQTGVAFDHVVSHFDGATHGVDDTAELDDCAVAGALDDAAVMYRDRRIDKVASKRAKPRQCAVFIPTDKSTESDHICGQNSGEFPSSHSSLPSGAPAH